MTDIRKDFEAAFAGKRMSPEEYVAAFIGYQAGRAHDIERLIAELIKQSGAFRDSENSGMIDIQRSISIIRKHFGKE